MNGLSVGIFWGLLVASVGVAIVSLSTPLPERGETGRVEADAGSEAEEEVAATDAPAPPAIAAEVAEPEAVVSDAAMADATQEEAPAPETAASETATPDTASPETNTAGVAGASGAPATDVPLPSGSEFNRPPPEPEAALPSPDVPVAAASPIAPLVAGDTATPRFDTATAALPNVATQAPAGLSAAAESGSALVAPALNTRPAVSTSPAALTQPQSSQRPAVSAPLLPQITPPSAEAEPEADAAPGPEALGEVVAAVDAPEEQEAPAASVAPEVVEASDATELSEVAEVAPEVEEVAPEVAEAETEPAEVAPEVAEVTPEVTEGESEVAEVAPEAAEVSPEVAEAASETAETPAFPTTALIPSAPVLGEETAVLSTPLFPQTSTLPQVAVPSPADPALSDQTPLDPEVPQEGADAAVSDTDQRAIEAFAAPFDTSEDRPLMAVVLIDEPESPFDLATLQRFTFPVAFAIDPLHPQAADRAAAYREAGFEVVIFATMIPDGATPSDLEVALSAAMIALPESVALLDTPDSRIQSDRPILDAAVGALAETGHGLLAFPRGLNAAEASANRSGVPGATMFRLLDDENQRATAITRFLARAAFAATQEGTVIVVGRTRPDTVTALFSWALGDRSEAVALAPLSATLLRASSP